MPAYEIAAPRVIHEIIDGEVVIIDLETGAYYSIRGDGMPIWDGIGAGVSTESIATALAIPIDRVEAFATELATEGLVQPGTISDADGWKPPVAEDRGPAVLERFTDMEDLLLLDPVHDVDPRGWPNAQP